MQSLRDKVIVVAGGATGIGAATPHRLAAEGARVVVGTSQSRDFDIRSLRRDGGEMPSQPYSTAPSKSPSMALARWP